MKLADIYGQVMYENEGYLYEYDFFGNGNLTTTGVTRTGCCFCLFGAQHDKERFHRLKKYEPKKYEFVMGGGEFENGLWVPNKQGLGMKFVIDWLNSHNKNNMRILY